LAKYIHCNKQRDLDICTSPEYAETEFKLSQQSFTWHRIVNCTRHHQCPIFPGEWVSQSGALKDLGNSFWVPAAKLTASLTCRIKNYIVFLSPQWGKREK